MTAMNLTGNGDSVAETDAGATMIIYSKNPVETAR